MGLQTRITDKSVRRRQLIESTIDSIARAGLAETTLGRVAQGAGLSQGIVNFHFRSKEALLNDTLKFLADEYRQTWRKALAAAPDDPARRLQAMVMADFHPRVFNRKKIAVWAAFFGEARARPAYLQQCEDRDRLHFEELRALCDALLRMDGRDDVDPEVIAYGIQALTDGLWLDHLVDPRGMDRATAEAITASHLAYVFPGHFEARPIRVGRCA